MRTKQLKINKDNRNNTIRDTQLRAPSASKDRSAKLMIPNGIIRLFLCLVVVGCVGAANVSALTYKSDVDVNFTIENAITIEVPSDGITINDLVPGNTKESDEAVVTIYSNNAYGYTLNASVGEETTPHNNRNLTNTANNNATFSSIDFGSSLPSLTTPGTWGYSYSADGTNWANFNGLPLYTDTKNVATLKDTSSSTSAAGDAIKMKIAAYADSAQTAGTYDNVINFAAVGKAAPVDYCKNSSYYCMQDLTLATCQTKANGTNLTVTDRRDGSNYTVKHINNECWMTQNLRIAGTIPASDSNFDGNDFNVSEYSLTSSDSSYADHCDFTNGYNYACAKDSGDTTKGVWYNYYAASAGTISTNSNTTAATSDICPAGWHLPTGPNTTSGTDYNKLVGNATSDWQAATAGLTAFGAVPGGYYSDGSLSETGYGYWWSATARNATGRHLLSYVSRYGKFFGDNFYGRHFGLFIRCVRSS